MEPRASAVIIPRLAFVKFVSPLFLRKQPISKEFKANQSNSNQKNIAHPMTTTPLPTVIEVRDPPAPRQNDFECDSATWNPQQPPGSEPKPTTKNQKLRTNA